MEHTYFFKPLKWNATGTYYDNAGNHFVLIGKTNTSHSENKWSLDGYMEVFFEKPVKFTNSYNITPSDDHLTFIWQSFNPALGILKGTFEVIGHYIVSIYASENGIYSGTETLIQIDESTYQNVGVSFQNGKRMSSWTASLTCEI